MAAANPSGGAAESELTGGAGDGGGSGEGDPVGENGMEAGGAGHGSEGTASSLMAAKAGAATVALADACKQHPSSSQSLASAFSSV